MGLRDELYAVFKPNVVVADDVLYFVEFLFRRTVSYEEFMQSEQAHHCVLESLLDAILTIIIHCKLPGDPEAVEDRREK